MKQGYWAIVTWTAGRIGEKIKYWVPGEKPTRSLRRRKADAKKILSNEKNAVRRMARLLNANFPGNEGVMIELDYSAAGMRALGLSREYDKNDPEIWNEAWEAAHHQLQLFLRRCLRACRESGTELRYIALTSDLGWDREIQDYVRVRVHHHVVLCPECAAICLRQWHLGGCGDRQLRPEEDHTALAEYLMGQVRRIDENKKYIPSRSLLRPECSAPRIAPTGKEVQPPKGAVLLERSQYEIGRSQYIRYLIPERDGRTPQRPDEPARGDFIFRAES